MSRASTALVAAAARGLPSRNATKSVDATGVSDKSEHAVTLNILDIAGNLALSQGMIEDFVEANEDIVKMITYTKASAPSVTGKLAVDGPAELAIRGAAAADDPRRAARLIGPEDRRIADVGEDTWAHNVRTVLGPAHSAGRLLEGETINPPDHPRQRRLGAQDRLPPGRRCPRVLDVHLWVMAGQGRTMIPFFHPKHARVQEGH